MRRRKKIVCRFLAPFDGWKEEEGKASSGVGKGPPSLRSRPTGGAFNRVSEVGGSPLLPVRGGLPPTNDLEKGKCMMCTNVCRFRPKAEAQSSQDQGREKAMERRRSAASLPSGEWGGMRGGERKRGNRSRFGLLLLDVGPCYLYRPGENVSIKSICVRSEQWNKPDSDDLTWA